MQGAVAKSNQLVMTKLGIKKEKSIVRKDIKTIKLSRPFLIIFSLNDIIFQNKYKILKENNVSKLEYIFYTE